MKRDLGLFDAILMVVGSMVGSGIFIVSTDMARMVGSPGLLLVTWLGTGLLVMAIALSFGELAAMMPKVGGQYVFLREAYNPLIGFLYGWTYFFVIATGSVAAVEMAFAKYSAALFPAFGEDNILWQIGSWQVSATQVVAMICIILLTAINCQGVRHGKIMQNVLTVTKLVTLVGMIAAGILIGYNHEVVMANFANFWQAAWTKVTHGGGFQIEELYGFGIVTAVATASVFAIFSMDSWSIIAGIAGEIKNPKKTIPLSLTIGVGTVVILYVLANVAYLCVLPLTGSPGADTVVGRGIQFATDGRVGAATIQQVFGPVGGVVLSFLIMLSCFGCSNGVVLGAARVYYAMARDGVFFKKMGELSPKGVPATALLWQCVWTCVLCLTGSFDKLAQYAMLAALLFYVLSVIGVFILRKKKPEAERPYKVIGYPVLPAVAVILMMGIIVDLLYFQSENTLPSLALVLLGVPVFFLRKWFASAKQERVEAVDAPLAEQVIAG